MLIFSLRPNYILSSAHARHQLILAWGEVGEMKKQRSTPKHIHPPIFFYSPFFLQCACLAHKCKVRDWVQSQQNLPLDVVLPEHFIHGKPLFILVYYVLQSCDQYLHCCSSLFIWPIVIQPLSKWYKEITGDCAYHWYHCASLKVNSPLV